MATRRINFLFVGSLCEENLTRDLNSVKEAYVESPSEAREMGTRALGIAWKVILIADLGLLLYGIMAVFTPQIFSAGYQAFTGQSWSQLSSVSPRTAEYILLLARLVGALNIAIGVVASLIVLMSFRRGEAWSWYALLIGNSIGYLSPMAYDQIVGSIGIFEQLEIVLIVLVYVALVISAKGVLRKDKNETM